MTAATIDLFLSLLDRATAAGALLSKAHSEGREVTDAEFDVLKAANDAAIARLEKAIAAA